jgi:hypothetical protein
MGACPRTPFSVNCFSISCKIVCTKEEHMKCDGMECDVELGLARDGQRNARSQREGHNNLNKDLPHKEPTLDFHPGGEPHR